MLPKPVVERLARLYRLLELIQTEGREKVSSRELEILLQEKAHTIRKDLSFLGKTEGNSGGYDVPRLRQTIGKSLGFHRPRNVCIVGLGRMGSAVLNHLRGSGSNLLLKAGFDSNINRLELLKTDIPLFPAYTIPEKVRSMNIVLGILTVPPESAQKTADRLTEGGIEGILNFSSLTLRCPENVVVRNISVSDELRALSGLLSIHTTSYRS